MLKQKTNFLLGAKKEPIQNNIRPACLLLKREILVEVQFQKL